MGFRTWQAKKKCGKNVDFIKQNGKGYKKEKVFETIYFVNDMMVI